jgi:hypothetical protein
MRRRGASEPRSCFALPIRSPLAVRCGPRKSWWGPHLIRTMLKLRKQKEDNPQVLWPTSQLFANGAPVSPTNILASHAASPAQHPIGDSSRLQVIVSSAPWAPALPCNRLFPSLFAQAAASTVLRETSRENSRAWHRNCAGSPALTRSSGSSPPAGALPMFPEKEFRWSRPYVQQIADAVICMPAECGPAFDCSCWTLSKKAQSYGVSHAKQPLPARQ